jgi:putative chitinase
MYNITPQLLKDVAGAPVDNEIVNGLVKYLPEALDQYGINTDLRLAHFLAQICHESDHFRTLEEYASGRAYEGRRDLGNMKRGDGVRYKGRGILQITGRANYKAIGKKLGFELENAPELAASPQVSVLTALEYWSKKKLNKWADLDDVKRVTKLINGGYNGLADRTAMLHRAKHAIKHMHTIENKSSLTEKKPSSTLLNKPPKANVSEPLSVIVNTNIGANN